MSVSPAGQPIYIPFQNTDEVSKEDSEEGTPRGSIDSGNRNLVEDGGVLSSESSDTSLCLSSELNVDQHTAVTSGLSLSFSQLQDRSKLAPSESHAGQSAQTDSSLTSMVPLPPVGKLPNGLEELQAIVNTNNRMEIKKLIALKECKLDFVDECGNNVFHILCRDPSSANKMKVGNWKCDKMRECLFSANYDGERPADYLLEPEKYQIAIGAARGFKSSLKMAGIDVTKGPKVKMLEPKSSLIVGIYNVEEDLCHLFRTRLAIKSGDSSWLMQRSQPSTDMKDSLIHHGIGQEAHTAFQLGFDTFTEYTGFGLPSGIQEQFDSRQFSLALLNYMMEHVTSDCRPFIMQLSGHASIDNGERFSSFINNLLGIAFELQFTPSKSDDIESSTTSEVPSEGRNCSLDMKTSKLTISDEACTLK